LKFTQRVQHLKAEGSYATLAQAQALEAQGRNIVHMEIGEPDFFPGDNVTLAGIKAISAGHSRYTPPAGMASLREAIAADCAQRHGISITPDQVVIGPGAKPTFLTAALAILDAGDEVIYPNPGFPAYEAIAGIAGGVAVPVPLIEENSFSYDLDAFDKLINERTKIIILNSPANPTGGVMSRKDIEHVAEAAQRYDCWVMSDEIYARLAYDNKPVFSIASLPGMAERTIIVDGFSKIYAMTGWRLGYGVMPLELANVIKLLVTHSIGCTAHFTQYAGLEALRGPQQEAEAQVPVYQMRRDKIVERLNAIPGIHCQKPEGAFYAFPNIKALGKTSREMASLLLSEGGVALLPGTAFGKYGEGYLRLSYATSMENIERGLERIEGVVRSL
jgi:aspartate/methionine/tyrosine aminotransferase